MLLHSTILCSKAAFPMYMYSFNYIVFSLDAVDCMVDNLKYQHNHESYLG